MKRTKMELFNLEEQQLYKVLIQAEKELFNSPKIKFERNNFWRKKHFKNVPGIYALFENKETLVYVGETGNLLKRMSDITRTVNHTFRKQIGIRKFEAILSSYKFDHITEKRIDDYFDNELYLSFFEVNFGRLEIETYLADKYKEQIFNSEKKRKQEYNYELMQVLAKDI